MKVLYCGLNQKKSGPLMENSLKVFCIQLGGTSV